MKPHDFLTIAPEVHEALRSGQPVVALESTIVAHGMPWPQNLETALEVQETVRSGGAVPATIAVQGGRLKVGLSASELELLAREGRGVGKVSRRDISLFLARPQLPGATTVASTMMVASSAGIRVFATGGIGGVHRGAELSWDVSADLMEFTRSGVAVVSAGAKAILDLPATLEYLETLGVPVLGYRTSEFPAFYSRSSGLPLEWRIDEVSELADVLGRLWSLDPHAGALIANPIPEESEIPADLIEPVIRESIREASSSGIRGKALTPFLLARLAEVTQGSSLNANMALVKNNARLGALLAARLAT